MQKKRQVRYEPNTLKTGPRALDVVVTAGEPLAQITIYDDLTLLTRRHHGRWTRYRSPPPRLATCWAARAGFGSAAATALGTGRMLEQAFTVVYVPPSVHTLRMEVG
ncbi:MAG: hypothetical protein IPK75_17665, partial [Acidobacteria bacterium]|nr:hypothetical protein [Acidobacteriota bacterium]